MIKKYIKEIHTKSEDHRKRFAYGASGALTLVIGLVWFTTYGYSSLVNTGKTAVEETPTYVASSEPVERSRPFTIMGANITNAINTVKTSMGLEKKKAPPPSLEYVPEY
jgi:hypothetical protein